MKRLLVKVISVVLVLTMVTGLASVGFAVSSNENIDTDFGLQSTDSFGNVLSEEMSTNADSGSIVNPNDPYALIDVHVIDKTAYVEYRAQENSTIVAAIYTEEGQLLGSGKETAYAENDKCVIDIDITQVPQYFVVKVFMLDSFNIARCSEMTCNTYTKVYQEFFSKEVSDFPDSVVINLDEDEINNFAVVSENVVEIYATDTENILKATDKETSKLIVGNINNTIKSLATGDIVYYHFGDNEDDFCIIKIGSITINGDEAVIVAETPEIEECFEYVRIEKNVTTSDEYVDVDTNKTVRTNSQVETQSIFSRWIAQIPEVTVGPSFHFEIDKDNDDDDDSGFNVDGSVDGTLDIKVNVTFKFYYFFDLLDEDYLDFKLVFNTTIAVGITVEGSVGYTIPLKEIKVPVFTGIEAVGQPKFIVEASGSIFIGYTMEKKSGFTKYCDEPKKTIDETNSDFVPEINAEIKIKIGVEIDFGVVAIKILYAKIIVEGGVEGSGKVKKNFSEDKKHLCSKCIEVTANLYASFGGEVGVSVKIDIFDIDEKYIIAEVKPLDITKPLFTGYLSDYYGSLKLYKGECPHYAYKITFEVVDTDGNAVSGASVGSLVTDSSGKVSEFYENDKTFNFSVSADGYVESSVTFKVNDKAEKIKIELGKEDEEESENPDNPSGSVGNITWTYNQATKTLTVSGSGNMPNYSGLSSAPWNGYYEEMKTIKIDSGITSIGDNAFAQCKEVTSVDIPDTVTAIGKAAFYGCNSLEEILIGNNIIVVGDHAFFDCYQAESLVLGSSLKTIGKYSFAQCENIESVVVPVTVVSIGEAAFKSCHELDYIKINNSACSINDSSITIPEDTVIYGFSGSTAQAYAINNSRSFVCMSSIATAAIEKVSADGLSTQSSSSRFYAKASGAIKGEEYILVVVNKNAPIFNCNTLLYIDQQTAENNGEISFAFIPKNNSDCDAYIIGVFTGSKQMMVYPQPTNKPVALTVSKLPSKTTYTYKENKIDLSGIVLTATYFNGSVEEIFDASLIEVVSFNTASTGEQTVVVSYNGAETEYDINVSYAWWQWIIRILLLGFIWY